MSLHSKPKRYAGAALLFLGLTISGHMFANILAKQLGGMIANQVGLMYFVEIRQSLMAGLTILLASTGIWFSSRYYGNLKSGFTSIFFVLAAVVMTSGLFYYHAQKDSEVNMEAEVQRTLLIHLTSWIEPEIRTEKTLGLLFAPDEEISREWDDLGHDQQLDVIVNLRTKSVVPYEYRSNWMNTAAKGTESIDTNDLLNNGLVKKDRDSLSAIALTFTSDARINLVLSLIGLIASMSIAATALLTMLFREKVKYLVILHYWLILPVSIFITHI